MTPSGQRPWVEALAQRLTDERDAKDPRGAAERAEMGLQVEDLDLQDLLYAVGLRGSQVLDVEKVVAYWMRSWIGAFSRHDNYENVLRQLADDLENPP